MYRTLLICTLISAFTAACVSPTQPRKEAHLAATPCDVSATASRIPASKPNECGASPGRSYSQDDIYRTGQTNVGDALQMLDPSVTVRH